MKQEKVNVDIWAFFLDHRLDVVLMSAGVLCGVLFGWNIVDIGIFVFFIAVILGYISLRSIGTTAMFFLAFTPILILFGRDKQAEEFAVYAYYFLVMAVIRGIVEVRNEK